MTDEIMHPRALYWGIIAAIGGGMVLIAVYALAAGPLFGGQMLSSSQMLLALGELFVGTFAFTGGAMQTIKALHY